MSSEETTAVTDVAESPPVSAPACLVVMYQRDGEPGKCIKLLDAPVRIGRAADNEVSLDDEGVSRRHVRIERFGDGSHRIMDVDSTNGTLVNDVELTETVALRNGDRIKIGKTIFKYVSETDLEAAFHEQIYEINIKDDLTRFFNKRYFREELDREFSRSRRHDRPLSMLFMDIDHFKKVNDERGHYVADVALKATADAIRSCLRLEDMAARYGGEEMVALLPEAKLTDAAVVAERIRATVEGNTIQFRDQEFTVTISIGCAELDGRDTDPPTFVQRCDAKLYEAKRAGRNCVRW
jgi:diguanylate cyclase (GGDEF)-like protein